MKSSRPTNSSASISSVTSNISRKGQGANVLHITGTRTEGCKTKLKKTVVEELEPTRTTRKKCVLKTSKEEPLASIRCSRSSVKRKLSFSLKQRSHSNQTSYKREKTDIKISEKIATGSKPRRFVSARMKRASSKDSLSSISSRENLALHVTNENDIPDVGSQKKNLTTIVKDGSIHLKELHKSRSDSVLLEVKSLQTENRLLRDHLKGLGISLEQAALSDAEKEFLLHKKCNSAPPSVYGLPPIHSIVNSAKDDLSEDGRLVYSSVEHGTSERGSLDWDKQSSSSLSEISVACLQDRILQMEETHYSTSEELQATLQELSDLQDQLTDLQGDNERLLEEKSFILESLCSKVQQLEEYRIQIDNLQQLLVQRKDDSSPESKREQKILDLFKRVKEEKEELMVKQEELNQQLQEADNKVKEVNRQLELEVDNSRLLESKLESSNTNKRLLEQQLDKLQEQLANDQIETRSIRAVLESERSKVLELQQAREIQNKSELDKLLDQVRKEKDRIESRANMLQEQCSISQCEAGRLRDQLMTLQEDNMVIKNNTKTRICDLEYKLQQVVTEKNEFHRQLLELQETVEELEHKCQRQRELRNTVSELQKKLNESYGLTETLQRQLTELQQRHSAEAEEWKQFQSDLLTSVRVANDFKTEAQTEKEKIALEKMQLQEKVQSLEAENERLKIMKTTTSPPYQRKIVAVSSGNVPESGVMNSIEHDLVVLRPNKLVGNRNDARISVKSLIASFNTESTPAKQTVSSCTINGGNTVLQRPVSAVSGLSIEKSTIKPILTSWENEIFIKLPSRPLSTDTNSILRDQKNQANTSLQSLRQHMQRNSFADNMDNQKSPEPFKADLNKPIRGTSPTKVTPEVDTGSKVVNVLPTPVSILANKSDTSKWLNYANDGGEKKDSLANLAKGGGSKRNALLKWCQNRTMGYKGIDITNFSSSWNDGLAFCALLHTYVPDIIPYDSLDNKDKRCNFTLAFKAAESLGIKNTLNPNDLILKERPDWQAVMYYVTSIYKHFET